MRARFLVQGVVQGVGFRPFVARLAGQLGLAGHVTNTTRGVEIEVQGGPGAVDAFARRLAADAPPVAAILSVDAAPLPPDPGAAGFRIRASRVDPAAAAIIPPDIATCPACLAELFDPADRRHGYPFVNCTDCGPRYTIIRSVPYDRERTSMAGFTLCPRCAAEYADPADRRFHAQPNACPTCGPRLRLLGPDGAPVPGDPVAGAAAAIAGGGIAAVLGLGGFHLACDAFQEDAVAALRRRKNRPAKPLAVMVPDLEAARRLAHLDPAGEALLAGARAPILLAPARPDAGLAPSVAPGQRRVGVMLPYTPLHHLLFRTGRFRALVMTSGNRSDEPILSEPAEALDRLAGVADRFLVHDRPILHPVDDSVVKSTGQGPVVVRRARGYAPAPIALPRPAGAVLLAVGAELANAYCVVRGGHAFLGPHVGDLKNLDVEDAFRRGIDHLLGLLRVAPSRVACDLHPAYRSTRYAEEWAARGAAVTRIQHHEAHVAACMTEHGFRDGEALGVALDGLGYGPDGTLWGGEILAGSPAGFRRVGHLAPVRQPGGDRAAREPWRMAAAHLRRALGPAWQELALPCLAHLSAADRAVLDTALDRGLNAPETTSCGRLFDAAAAILGFTGPMRYSAQAPMELEAWAAAAPAGVAAYPFAPPREGGDVLVLDPAGLVRAALRDARRGRDRREAALAFHRGLAGLLAAGIRAAAEKTGLVRVFLTGGCLQNAVLADLLRTDLEAAGLTPRFHRQVPPNDGGVALGQAACALSRPG